LPRHRADAAGRHGRRSVLALNRMATLVLLPGMDGTGDLFAPFVAAYAGPTKVVRYPPSEFLGYQELEEVVQAQLPDGPYVLLGESFSGPLAISLAAERPHNLLALVLCASFARNPRPALGPLSPLAALLPARPPLRAMEFMLCGRFANPALRQLLQRALTQVAPAVLRERLKAVASVNVTSKLQRVEAPVLYLSGSEDRLVPAASGNEVRLLAKTSKLVEFTAPHFLLQCVPMEAACTIREFMTQEANAA